MAYSDYGAFVWLNGKRRKDKEDVAAFKTDEETFGMSSDEIPSGLRIFASIIHRKEAGEEADWFEHIHHGIMGDGDIRVICHKQGLPQIVEATENGIENVTYCSEDIDYFEYAPIHFKYRGYKFRFESGKPYYAEMVTPNGDLWVCKYDYLYGAGHTDAKKEETKWMNQSNC